jgi:Lon protease-like protein
MGSVDHIPLFPLGLVLLPHMALPLHIFEERYKLMIRECLDQGKAFGIVHVRDSNIERIGCTARITDVLKRYEDGRMDILTKGERRFLITSLDETRPYLRAAVRYIEDDTEPLEQDSLRLGAGAVALLKDLNRLLGRAAGAGPPPSLDLADLSFFVAGHEAFVPDERQELLGSTSPAARLEKVIDLLRKKIETLKAQQEIRRIIGGNGKVRDRVS